jgi:hypothetical protein
MKTINEAYMETPTFPELIDYFRFGVEFAQSWIPINEEMPEKLIRVLCQVEYGTNKNPWTIIAQYVPPMTVKEEDFMSDEFWGEGDYNEEEDQYYTPAGWYEANLYSDINYKVSDEVISWRPFKRD